MFKTNKYTKWYYDIVTYAKLQLGRTKNNGYFENHHIIPRSMGGTNNKDNMVMLTAREHFICHMLLTKMTDNNGMRIAFGMMLNWSKKYKPNASKIYEYGKKCSSEAKRGINNPMFGKHVNFSDSHRLNIKSGLKSSRKFHDSRKSKEYKLKISDAFSEEICLYSPTSNKVIGTWKNCTELAEFLGCTRGNVKNARRNKRLVGKKLKTLTERCYVVYSKDLGEWIN